MPCEVRGGLPPGEGKLPRGIEGERPGGGVTWRPQGGEGESGSGERDLWERRGVAPWVWRGS